MVKRIPLDAFANHASCDLRARHVESEEEQTFGRIVGFFHQRIIAGRQVTKSRHILLSREYHQRQKQIPAGKKESLTHSPSHVSPQRCQQLEAVSIMIARTVDSALQNSPRDPIFYVSLVRESVKQRKVIAMGKGAAEHCPCFSDLHASSQFPRGLCSKLSRACCTLSITMCTSTFQKRFAMPHE